MNTSREQILQSIRRSLKRVGPLEESMSETLDARLARHPVHVQPVVEGDLSRRFIAKLEAVAGTVARVSSLADVPQAVIDYLKGQSLTLEVVMASETLLAGIEWPPSLKIEQRAAKREDEASITGAFAGIAETGTLVLVSSASSPTTLNFLPDAHIVVLRHDQIVAHVEDIWTRLRGELSGMPRTVNFITGPSRTADVEQTIQLGAHGPRSLHVILVDHTR